jgi:hypothetical protein
MLDFDHITRLLPVWDVLAAVSFLTDLVGFITAPDGNLLVFGQQAVPMPQ